ncbi:MAG: cation:proton antiporter [Chloroflexi bacterium]|nr:cation:proton antiporter [Chloroflexota bacterium]
MGRWLISAFRTLAPHLILALSAALLFFRIRGWGEQIPAPALNVLETSGSAGGQTGPLLPVLLALTTIVFATRLVGAAARYFQQPAVMGEVIAGLMLGPSLLGWMAPEALTFLLPQPVMPVIGALAQLGVILYMFLVGTELDLAMPGSRGRAIVSISQAGIIVPFLLGSLLALGLYQPLAQAGVSFTSFALFVGVAMCVTAFPVLARILRDEGVHRTEMGNVALTCAAIGDATAWCLLSLAVSVSKQEPGSALATILLTIVFVALMLTLGRPLMEALARSVERRRATPDSELAGVLVAVLISALATEMIGIHALFGAFLLGAVLPHRSRLASDLGQRITGVVQVLLLPAFFAFTGLRTEIRLLDTVDEWLLCFAIILIATMGKFGGVLVAGRLNGIQWRDATALGALMNSRGLVELIVLNIGLDLRVISPTLFTMLVVMALTTTLMTTPLFRLITRRHPWSNAPDALTRASDISSPGWAR